MVSYRGTEQHTSKIVGDLQDARITFHKAKMFGIHTGMYALPPDFHTKAGKKLRFTWETDGS
jgi:hypothetical protein